MPCHTVNMISLDLKARNKDLIMKVLQAMKQDAWTNEDNTISSDIGTFDLNTGKAEVWKNRQKKFNEFRINYSKEIVLTAAKKYKFAIKADSKNPNKFVLNRW